MEYCWMTPTVKQKVTGVLPRCMKRAHSAEEMAGVAAISSMRERRLVAAAVRRMGGLRCVLERLEDRGNRSAVLRTTEALGLLHVHEICPAHPEQAWTVLERMV